MTKLEKLNKAYQDLKDRGEDIEFLILDIQMPTGELERICNPNVKEKINYINKTYSKDLVHANCKDIYIVDYDFVLYSETYTFSEILEFLKDGFQVRRRGWNGKGLSVAMQLGYAEVLANEHTINAFNLQEGDTVKVNPYFQIKDANNVLNTWVPSVSDILAEDWEVI